MNPQPMPLPAPHEEAEVLRRRARQLARRVAAREAHGSAEALAFAIAGQECVLELGWLREVRALGELLVVPHAPLPLLGLVHLRGRMLPVLDIRALLGIDESSTWRPGRLLVLGRKAPELGIAVCAVGELQALSAGQAEHRSQPLEGMRPELVRGVTPAGLLVLDGERLLALHDGAGP
jgi:purine-binding chemotaxis protein CheW